MKQYDAESEAAVIFLQVKVLGQIEKKAKVQMEPLMLTATITASIVVEEVAVH